MPPKESKPGDDQNKELERLILRFIMLQGPVTIEQLSRIGALKDETSYDVCTLSEAIARLMGKSQIVRDGNEYQFPAINENTE